MEHELIVHFPVYDFPERQESAVEAFHIIGRKKHGVRASEDPLVWRLVGLRRGVIGEGSARRSCRHAFSEADIVPGAVGRIGQQRGKARHEVFTQPDIGFQSYDEALLGGGGLDGGGEVESEADLSAAQ